MSKYWIILLFVAISCSSTPRTPENGTYDYRIEFAEFVEGAMTVPCKVQFKNDSVFVINIEDNFLGAKGDTLDTGILTMHKSGRWIILHNEDELNADEVGGCTDGPTVIDIEKKIYWMC